ncbi:helix-turn-helix domain-containing protein [Paracandidimonas soli]|uniref:helix-turn-helix domain-containing protein n=1 Tax=Paracandidimonas soli TaxID=1917182 RepID=UPI003340740A
MKNFANRLRYAREMRGLTQTELAKASGISQSAIANYENGTRKTAKNIFKLAKALQLNPLWLAEGVLPMEPSLAEPAQDYAGANFAGASWPFHQISPQTWKSLSAHDRQIVEHTISALIRTLQNRQDTP